MSRFEDIIAWRKARELVKHVYGLCTHTRDFGFRDQIQRASVSIMNNIAEGFERKGSGMDDILPFKTSMSIASSIYPSLRTVLVVP